MKYVLIDPAKVSVKIVDCTWEEAFATLGLKPGEVDFGTLAVPDEAGNPGLTIVVYQFGLYDDPSTQRYFQLGNNLYAGGGLLYAFNREGDTVDMPCVLPVSFFANAQAVERAIEDGRVARPRTMVNEKLIWEWKAVPDKPI
jgi:hypothetical protein